jgi:hypothetical protein
VGELCPGQENKNLPGYVLLHAGAVPPGGLKTFPTVSSLPRIKLRPCRPMVSPLSISNPLTKPQIQRAKLDVLLQEDRQFLQSIRGDDAVESAIQNYEMAYKMQSVVPDVLNLDRNEATRKLYGLTQPTRTSGCTARNACAPGAS